MVEGTSLGDFLDLFNKLVLDLSNIGVVVDKEDLAVILLNALPPSYSVFCETIKYSKDSLILDDVLVALKSKNFDDFKDVSSSLGEGLVVSHGREGNGEARVKDVECWHCHKKGHVRKDCPKRKRAKERAKNKGKGEGNKECQDQEAEVDVAVGFDDYHSADLLVAEASDCTNQSLPWILDSGCTQHMCPNIAHFDELESGSFGQVKLGSQMVCQVKGLGSVKMVLDHGKVVTLNGVMYVPDLRLNFVSLRKLDKQGCEIKIKAGHVEVMKNNDVVLTGEVKGDLYELNGAVFHEGIGSEVMSSDEELLVAETDLVMEQGGEALAKQVYSDPNEGLDEFDREYDYGLGTDSEEELGLVHGEVSEGLKDGRDQTVAGNADLVVEGCCDPVAMRNDSVEALDESLVAAMKNDATSVLEKGNEVQASEMAQIDESWELELELCEF